MKKHNKKKDCHLVDLNARGSIIIVQSDHKSNPSQRMQDFENRFMARYNDYCEFTELCFKKNKERNQSVSIQEFHDAIQSMVDQNNLLENMIEVKEQDC